jgi:hypothetical protein
MCNSPEINTSNLFPLEVFDQVTLGIQSASNTFDQGVWSGPVENAVPEPGTLSMMFSGLLGLGMLVGVKRYRLIS